MSSLLRQSRSSLARISRTSLTSASSAARRAPSTTRLTACRHFASAPPPPPSNKNPKKPSKKLPQRDEDAAKKPDAKPAPGTENLYEDGKAPLSANSKSSISEAEPESGSGSKDAEQPLAEGMARLSEEDMKSLEDMLEMMKKGLPRSEVEMIEKSLEMMRKEGVPKELKEMADEMRNKPMTLVSAAKLTRLATSLVNRKGMPSSSGVKSNKGKGVDFEGNETKSSSSGGSGGSGDGKKGKQGKEEGGGGFRPDFKGDFKIDTSSFLLSAFVSYLLYRMVMPGETGRDITFQEFRSTFLDKGLVEKLTVVNGNRVRVELHREAAQSMYPDSPAVNPNFHYYFSIGSVEAFERKLEEAQRELGIPTAERIPVSYSRDGDAMSLVLSFGPTLLLVGMIWYMTRRASQGSGGPGSVFGMMKSRAKQFNHEKDVKVKFKDVAGMDEAKLEIMEFVSFLKTPEQFERLGAKIPRGAILSGPPGTGKTLLAKATAGESSVPFFSVSGSEFVEMFVGVGAARVRDLFSMARKNTPCIIFIDEIDAIGKARGKGNFAGNDEREATLNQILTEMDGFDTQEQVVVLAGTNRPDVLDKALMRPGRFDRHIAIDRPDMNGRKQIFLVHLRKIVTNEDMEYLTGRLSALTPGFSGADIANCCNEAALIAARGNAKSVAMIHFEQAIERVIGGLEKKSLVLSPEEKRTVAYHEAGHAICGWYFKYADPLLKVSIIPRGNGALGYAQYLPAADTYLLNVNQLMDRMAMTLGGRISEELHFDTVTSGASDDFNKVTRMATAMVTKWGMSKALGPLHFQDDENRFQKPFAEATAQTIDAEVRRIVDEAYKQCRDLLTEKKAEVGIVAEELLSKEVLGRDDMVRLLGARPFDENKDFVKYFGGGPEGTPKPSEEQVSSPPPPASADLPPENPPAPAA